jgi:hypothetical protein
MSDDYETSLFEKGKAKTRERRTQTVSTKITQEEECELHQVVTISPPRSTENTQHARVVTNRFRRTESSFG